MMCEPFFHLIFRYLFLLEGRRLDVNCGDFCCCRIYPHICKVFLARPRNVERPDQHSVFFFKLSTLDRATLNSSERNSFSLMLRHACLLKQYRFTLLCPQIEGRPARGECQCDDRWRNWLHTSFDHSPKNCY